MGLVEIVGRAGTTHLRRYPTRFEGILQNDRPKPSHCKRQQNVVQLRVGVGLL
jgi:hypothetical protein